MLLQTNSYVVPRDKRMEHARILRRFRQTLLRLGCDHFEVYEQVGANWAPGETSGRYVQIMRFRDRKHQLAVQAAERSDPSAQALLREFCELINLPYQQQQGLFAVGFYTSFLRMPSATLQHASDQPGEELAVHQQEQLQEHASTEELSQSQTEETNGEHNAGETAAAHEVAFSEVAASSNAAHEQGVATQEHSEPSAAETPVMEETTPGMTEPVGAESITGIEAAARAADDTAPEDSQKISHESVAPADMNDDELNAEARNELPADSEGIDSESVFLGAMDGDLEDPGTVRPLALDDTAEADTEKPTSPSK
jgi:hypothetical protein